MKNQLKKIKLAFGLFLVILLIQQTSYGQTAVSTADALKNLNEYLKIFNPDVYKDVEIKENNIIFNYKVSGAVFSSVMDIAQLKAATIKKQISFGANEVRIVCSNESYCIYSHYEDDGTNHFRFYSYTVKDLSTLETLITDLISTL